jgi:hypothetical protein
MPNTPDSFRQELNKQLNQEGRAIYGMVDGSEDAEQAFSFDMALMREKGLRPKIILKNLNDQDEIKAMMENTGDLGVFSSVMDQARKNTVYVLTGDAIDPYKDWRNATPEEIKDWVAKETRKRIHSLN